MKNLKTDLRVLSAALLSGSILIISALPAFATPTQGLDDQYWYVDADRLYQTSDTGITGQWQDRDGLFGMFFEAYSGTDSLKSTISARGIMDSSTFSDSETGLWQVYQATGSAQTVSIDLNSSIRNFDDGHSYKSGYDVIMEGSVVLWTYNAASDTWTYFHDDYRGMNFSGDSMTGRDSEGSDNIQFGVNLSPGTLFALEIYLITYVDVYYQGEEGPDDIYQSISGDFYSNLTITSVEGATLTSVPVPATAWLLGIGILGLFCLRFKQKPQRDTL